MPDSESLFHHVAQFITLFKPCNSTAECSVGFYEDIEEAILSWARHCNTEYGHACHVVEDLDTGCQIRRYYRFTRYASAPDVCTFLFSETIMTLKEGDLQ